MNSLPVKLSRKGVERWTKGHPWIYQTDVEAPKGLSGGEVVRVVDHRGYLMGQAFFSRASKISLRALTRDDTLIDTSFFVARLAAADALRRKVLPDADTYRVVHGEADGLPGLIVDRFGDYLSVQFLIPGMEQRKDLICDLLEGHFKPKAIVNRSDVGVRKLEGLLPEKGVLRGKLPEGPLGYREGDVEIEVDLLHGQKTGAFLDQRENHVAARQYATGRALDCFSYLGGFALQLAKVSSQVTAVEISEPACEKLKANAVRNGLTNVEVVAANAFDWLRDALDEGKKFDTVVLDPPSFAKNKGAVDAAVRGYKEINLRAIQLLERGGVLISCSCTHHVNEERFEEILDSAAADAGRKVQIIEKRGAGRDHPVLLGLRETRYLKCYVLRVL